MSITTAPPMPPAAPPPGGALPLEAGAEVSEEQQAIYALAQVAEQVVLAMLQDPTVVKTVIKAALQDQECVEMLRAAVGGGAPDTFSDDLEALVSGSDDLEEITDDDLAMMSVPA